MYWSWQMSVESAERTGSLCVLYEDFQKILVVFLTNSFTAGKSRICTVLSSLVCPSVVSYTRTWAIMFTTHKCVVRKYISDLRQQSTLIYVKWLTLVIDAHIYSLTHSLTHTVTNFSDQSKVCFQTGCEVLIVYFNFLWWGMTSAC